MRVLRDTASIKEEITSCPDRSMADLLASHMQFVEENEEGVLIAIMVEPGDTLQDLDGELEGKFLINHYGRRRYGEPGFRPCFETLEEHPSFYEMFFIEGDEVGVTVLIPKALGVDLELLALCAQYSTPVQELSS